MTPTNTKVTPLSVSSVRSGRQRRGNRQAEPGGFGFLQATWRHSDQGVRGHSQQGAGHLSSHSEGRGARQRQSNVQRPEGPEVDHTGAGLLCHWRRTGSVQRLYALTLEQRSAQETVNKEFDVFAVVRLR